MNKVRSTVKHMPRKAKLLTALLACVLVLTLIGVGIAAEVEPTYIHPAIRSADVPTGDRDEVTVTSGDLEFSRPQGDNLPLFNGTKHKTLGWIFESWAYNENNRTLEGKVGSVREGKGKYNENQGVLRIKNISGSSKKLTFNYAFSMTENLGSNLQIASSDLIKTAQQNKEYTTNLPAGGSIDIRMWVDHYETSRNDLPCATITITNIKTEAVSGQTLVLCNPDNSEAGTYTAKNGDTPLTIGNTVPINTENKETVTLTAQPEKGYKFYLWVDKDGKPLSTAETFKVNGLDVNPGSVKPVFVPENATAYYQIPGNGHLSGKYYYWDDAMKAAGYSDSKNVVLLADLKLENAQNRNSSEDPAKTFTIPSGVTLVVPYSNKLSTKTDDKINVNNEQMKAEFGVTDSNAGSAYRTLTVTKGYTLNVNGTLLVNALQGADNGTSYQSHIVGTYGKMVVGGTVTVNAGAKLYARGYVVDANHSSGTHNGQINVKSGGSLIQMMQITDWRGGHYTLAVYQQLMPITMYYLQNNMVDTVYEYGSTMRAQAVIAYQNISATDKPYEAEMAEVRIITNATDTADSTPYMFVMKNDAIIKTSYDYETDRLRFTLENGTASMNALTISAGQLKIDTANNVLAVSDNMPITVGTDATLETNYDLKFLPGAELTVNGTLNIKEDSDLYFYGKGDYQSIWSDDQFRTHIQPVGSIGNDEPIIIKEAKTTPETDAMLNLNGTLNLSGTLSQSTNHSGLLADAGEGAKVIINQRQHDGKSVNESLNRNYTSSPTPASDSITYVKADDYYYAVNKGWKEPTGHLGENPGTLVGMENTGTYKRDTGNKFWYQFALTVNYSGIEQQGKTVYVSKSSTVLNAPENTVITAISGVEEQNRRTVQSVNYNNALTDGWKQVQLLNLNADKPVTLTCKSYDKTLIWNEYYGETTANKPNNTVMSYLSNSDSTASHTFEGTVTKVTAGDRTLTRGTDYTLSDENKTVTLSNVTGIEEVSVYTRDVAPTVTWNVIDPNGTPVEVSTTENKYTITQPDNAWWVAETGDCSVSDTNVTVTISQDKRTLTLSGITGPVTVTVNLTEYKHCINGTITYDQLTITKDNGYFGEYIKDFKSEFGQKAQLQNLYTNDDEYRWTIPGDGEKNLLTKIEEISGCSIGGTGEKGTNLRQEIGNTLTVQLTDIDVKLQVTTRNYLSKMTWEVTGPDTVDTKDLGYTEYYTAQVDEANQYVTLLSNGKTGVVDYDDNYMRVASAYTVPDSIQCTVELANGDGENVPADEAGKKACWSYTPTEMSKKFECYLEDAWNGGAIALAGTVDSTAQLTLKPYAYTVKFVDAAKPSASLKEYYVTEGTDSVTYNEGWMDEEWNNLCITNFQITGGSETKLNGLSKTPAEGLIIEGDDYGHESGCTLTGITGNTTVKLTFAKCSEIFSKKIDWKINDLKNNESYSYREYLRKDATSGFVNAFETVDVTANSHVWAGSKVTYTLPDEYDGCYIKENTDDKTDRRSIAADTWNGKITIQPYAKRVVAYINKVPSYYYYFDTMDAQPRNQLIYCGDNITVSGCIAKGCDVTNLNASDPTSRNVKLNSVTATDARVDIWTEPTGTDVTTSTAYYMGDMSFEYVRNAAAFTWDGKTEGGGSWKPVNAFGWRHAVGSKSYEVGGKTLTVDNGSILFVNTMQNTPVTYTVQLSNTDGKDYGVSLMFDQSENIQVSDAGVATVTVKPNSRVTLVCRMTGTPDFSSGSEIEIGTITVTKN